MLFRDKNRFMSKLNIVRPMSSHFYLFMLRVFSFCSIILRLNITEFRCILFESYFIIFYFSSWCFIFYFCFVLWASDPSPKLIYPTQNLWTSLAHHTIPHDPFCFSQHTNKTFVGFLPCMLRPAPTSTPTSLHATHIHNLFTSCMHVTCTVLTKPSPHLQEHLTSCVLATCLACQATLPPVYRNLSLPITSPCPYHFASRTTLIPTPTTATSHLMRPL